MFIVQIAGDLLGVGVSHDIFWSQMLLPVVAEEKTRWFKVTFLIPKRWRSPTTFEFGSRELTISLSQNCQVAVNKMIFKAGPYQL